MKAQTKAIVASVVVIALTLTAISGVTYSWFSDTEQSDISVSTGVVDIKTEMKYPDNLSINNNNISVSNMLAGYTGSFKAILSHRSTVNTDINVKIQIDANDLVTYDLKNIIVSIGDETSTNTSSLFDLGITSSGIYTIGIDSISNQDAATSYPDYTEIKTYSISITTPTSYGDGGNAPNDWSSEIQKNMTMKIISTAIQYGGVFTTTNADVNNNVATSTINDSDEVIKATDVKVGNTSSKVDVSVQMSPEAISTTNVSGGTLKITAKTSPTDSGFDVGGEVVIDLSLTGDDGVISSFDGYVTITITLPGVITNPHIVYNGQANPDYDSYLVSSQINNGKTEIIFKTNHFSEYIVMTSETVEVSTADALYNAAAAGVPNIVLATDISMTTQLLFPYTANVTLDLNGKTLQSSYGGSFIVNYGSLTIDDSSVNEDAENYNAGKIFTTNLDGYGRSALVNYGKMVVNNGIIGDSDNDTTNDNTLQVGYALVSYGETIVNYGHFTACDNYVPLTIGVNGYSYVIGTKTGGKLTINDCYVYGKSNGLIFGDGGNITVNGGKYYLEDTTGEKTWYLIYLNANASAIINDGVFEKHFGVQKSSIRYFSSVQEPMDIEGGVRIDGNLSICGGTFKKNSSVDKIGTAGDGTLMSFIDSNLYAVTYPSGQSSGWTEAVVHSINSN